MARRLFATQEELSISREGLFSKIVRKLDDKLFGVKQDNGDEIFTFDITFGEEEYDVDEFAKRTTFTKAYLDLIIHHSTGTSDVAMLYEGPAKTKDLEKVINGSKESIELFKQWEKDLGKQRRRPYTVDSSYLHTISCIHEHEMRHFGTKVANDVDDKTIKELFSAIDKYEKAYNDFCKALSKFIIKREKKRDLK